MSNTPEMLSVIKQFATMTPITWLPMLVEYLEKPGTCQADLARWILIRTSRPLVLALIREALCYEDQPEHCIQILDIIETIGKPLGVVDRLVLAMMRRESPPAVREKARRLLDLLGQPPDIATGRRRWWAKQPGLPRASSARSGS